MPITYQQESSHLSTIIEEDDSLKDSMDSYGDLTLSTDTLFITESDIMENDRFSQKTPMKQKEQTLW
eukprot:CAMPEP_0113330100 /NCGR_PEP_ID=MMETSP0010_2-20120614/21381_1 /TAXON_ID=216773 ORGANISM="Corethron hystrix, Strain 308" /NCGR_SAMPLE_ID=MMETSP0010_2 /ASSEMBLY_ACC=CAM_ASM_000155 /LENGTH=66 /DNA_ID=CAMNT_0000192489 /DNA_START=90 /DNA_END=287 /DNA_ORIENTATION=- /assembly_acc=CAM_ASM_000155